MLALCTGCQKNEVIGEYCIRFEERHYDVKALDPDEERITDISLMVFDEDGKAEECIWQPSADTGIRLKLVKGRTYSFRACLNFGYRVYADEIGELDVAGGGEFDLELAVAGEGVTLHGVGKEALGEAVQG